MKGLIALILLLAFVFGGSATILAKDDDHPEALQWCEANENLGYKNIGRCVRAFMSCYAPGNTGAECACEDFLNGNPQEFYVEYNNMATCINHLRYGYAFE